MNILQLLRSINPLELRGSWKTTLCGMVAVLCLTASEFELPSPEYRKVVEFTGLSALGLGLMLARDANKRSEDHNLPPPPPTP